MQIKKYYTRLVAIIAFLTSIACEDLVDVDTPNFQMVSENVFKNDDTAKAAVTGMYNQLMNADFSNGWQNSVTVLAGMSADIIAPRSTSHNKYSPFWNHEISTIDSPDAQANLQLWSSAYNIIYLANSILEELDGTTGTSETTSNHLRGQALFIRAFTYFYLTNLYKEVPLLLTTDYRNNALAPRNPEVEIWERITADLDEAITLLDGVEDYKDGERTRVNKYVAKALLARVYLYQQNWSKAEELSSEVISQVDTYEILDDLDQVFLANSREAIWQISPAGLKGGRTTYEANVFTRYPIIPGVLVIGDIKLTNGFVQNMQAKDKRLTSWIGQELNKEGQTINYYSFKYKTYFASGQHITEYSMVLRLAEQYLIRAEARTMQNKVSEAITDVDKLRKRAGIKLLKDISPGINKDALLKIIMEERKRELFTEWGHRWLDLKRTAEFNKVFSDHPLWQDSDVWYPIPEEERMKNPNLTQNKGY